MASAEYNWEQLNELIDGDISKKELVDLLPLLKVDVDEVTEDSIIVDITPDRPDFFSEEGVSRMINFYKFSKSQKEYKINNSNYEVNVDLSNSKCRPFTVASVIKGIKLDENKLKTIIRVQEKLHTTLGRNREKVAIGIYPKQKINFPISFESRRPKDISFQPLESNNFMTGNQILSEHEAGKKYSHLLSDFKKYPIFVDDSNNILSMPPIINSEYTGRVESGKNDLFIECSGFDLESLNLALNLLVTMFYDMGGEIFDVKINYPKNYFKNLNFDSSKFSFKNNFNDLKKEISFNSPDLSFSEIDIDFKLINKLLGNSFTKKEIKSYLKQMCFIIKGDKALIPPYRSDILHNVDLAEEVSIAYGFDNIVPEELLVPGFGKIDSFQKFKSKVNDLMISLNLQPTKNYSIDNIKNQEKFLKESTNLVKLSNPVNKEFNVMRGSLIPQQFEFLEYNKKREYPQSFFEIGEIFKLIKKNPFKHKEIQKLSITKAGNVTLTDIKQIVNSLFDSFDLCVSYKEESKPFLINGRCAKIILNEKAIGFLGEVHPKFLVDYDLNNSVVTSELNLSLIYNQIFN